MDKIEKIKKILKEKKVYKKNLLLYYFYGYVKNLKIAGLWEKENKKADIYKDSLTPSLTAELREEYKDLPKHSLLAVIPINFSYSKTSKFERLFDEFFRDTLQTIFIDLDSRVYGAYSSRSSGSRGSYQTLAEIFEKKKAPTLIPILAKKEIVKLYIFPRFIGSTPYPQQWRDIPKEFKKKGYSLFSYVSRRLDSDNIEIFLDPDKKEIDLVRFFDPFYDSKEKSEKIIENAREKLSKISIKDLEQYREALNILQRHPQIEKNLDGLDIFKKLQVIGELYYNKSTMLLQYLGERCKYCKKEFQLLEDLQDTIWVGPNKYGRLAHKECFEADKKKSNKK